MEDTSVKNLLFIVNPTAGKTHIKTKLFQIIDIFHKAGYRVIVHPTQSPHDARDTIIETGHEYDLVVCAGGDGTLDNTVTGIMMSGYEIPLGYIPCGSTNDFANSLKIPKDPLSAATKITTGSPYFIDVGSMNDDYFIYVASFGAFVDVSYSTPQKSKNILGHAAYVLEGIKSLPTITSYHVEVSYDDVVLEDDYIFAMVTNSLSVGGFKSISNKDVEFDDGLFEVLLIKNPQNAIELNSIINALILNDINEDYMTLFKASEVTFKSDVPIPWGLDGEYGGDHYEAVIKNHQKSLQLMRKTTKKG